MRDRSDVFIHSSEQFPKGCLVWNFLSLSSNPIDERELKCEKTENDLTRSLRGEERKSFFLCMHSTLSQDISQRTVKRVSLELNLRFNVRVVILPYIISISINFSTFSSFSPFL